MALSNHPAYRPDIDGLRAIAVLSVIGYHAFPSAVNGGFVGVDIFFVISGYLISTILLKSLDREEFSLKAFYARRIRRIFPALILVLVASLIFGWFVLLADEYEQLGKHVVGGAAFVSNIVLWDEVDYFNTAAELKPLLHLWSLGVEEQFYILFPVFLFLAWRLGPTLPALVLSITAASFLLNIATVQTAPAATFYLPFSRFWELLAGSLLAYLTLFRSEPSFGSDEHQTLRAVLARLPAPESAMAGRLCHLSSAAGTVLIVLAVFTLDEHSAFPGWQALMPTCGALLLIAAGPQAFLNRLLLARSTMVFIGLISYPLYLWHWPLLSFARIVGHDSLAVIISLVVASIALAWMTYRFVERPIRWQKRDSNELARITARLAVALAGVTLIGLAVWGSLLPGRLDAISRDIVMAQRDWSYPGDGVVGEVGSDTVLFFGDSYIRQYYPRIEQLSLQEPWASKTILFETEGGCAPFIGIERIGQTCNDWSMQGYALADQEEVTTVILGASWIHALKRGDYYRAEDRTRRIINPNSEQNDWIFTRIEERVQNWVDDNKRVYIILANPDGVEADPGSKISDRLAWRPAVAHDKLSLARHLKKSAFAHGKLRQIAENTGATLIDPALWLCEGEYCETESVGGIPMYCDDGHLRGSFVRDKVRYLDNILNEQPEPE